MKNLKIILSTIVSTLIVSGIAYAASITSVTTQTINTSDTIGAVWYQTVNDRLISLLNLCPLGVCAPGSAVPANAVMAFNQSTCPTGWIAADGQWGRIDLRGEFVRGWDSRAFGAPGSVDGGRGLASFQDGSRVAWSAANPTPIYMWGGTNYDQYAYCASPGTCIDIAPNYLEDPVRNNIASPWLIGFAGYSSSTTTSIVYSKVRPRNIALLYCIKQ